MKLNLRTRIAAISLALASGHAIADINVGVVFSLTGPAASLGAQTRKAIDLMPATLGGEKVNFIVLDDATDPTIAVQNARKLISEHKVDVIIGANLTSAGVAMSDVANSDKVSLLSMAPIEVSPEKRKWVFRVEPSADIMVGRAVADMKAKGINKVAFIGFSDSWGELLLNGLKKATKKHGLEIVATERYGRTDTSVMAQALKVNMANPDAVFIGGSGTPAALPQIALRDRGYKGAIYQSHAVTNKEFLRVGGKAVEGARLAVAPVLVAEQLPYYHPNIKVALDFVSRFEAKYPGESRSTFAGATWDSWLMLQGALTEALKIAKPGTAEFREAVRDGMEKTKDLVGANGVYTMTAEDHGGYDPVGVVLVKVEDGRWVLEK